MIKICKKHGETEFGKTRCLKCIKEEVKLSKYQSKIRLIQLLGGKCHKCGYDKCIAALDFHHKDPSTKKFTIGSKIKSFIELEKEALKCELLCSNCHREFHFYEQEYDFIKIDWKKIPAKNMKYIHSSKSKIDLCKCGNKKRIESKTCKYCCFRNKQKADFEKRVDRNILEKEVWQCPLTKLALKYNVSDNAIKKWCIKLQIERPPQGYWLKKR